MKTPDARLAKLLFERPAPGAGHHVTLIVRADGRVRLFNTEQPYRRPAGIRPSAGEIWIFHYSDDLRPVITPVEKIGEPGEDKFEFQEACRAIFNAR